MEFAYLDAGTGSIVIQAIAGTAAGTIYLARNFLKSLAYKFRSSSEIDDSNR